MTVAELIAALSALPPDAPVIHMNEEDGCYYETDDVESVTVPDEPGRVVSVYPNDAKRSDATRLAVLLS